jgi:hypothetical protein
LATTRGIGVLAGLSTLESRIISLFKSSEKLNITPSTLLAMVQKTTQLNFPYLDK